MSFSNKVVIITGGSSGIGAATAVMLSKKGASIVIVGRNEDRLEGVANKCASAGSRPLIIKANISDKDDADRIIRTTLDKYGKINVLVNNAGVSGYSELLGKNIMQTLDENMNVNLKAVVRLTALAAPYLIQTKGNVVDMSSAVGSSVTLSSNLAYNISKAALDYFTKAAAMELASAGVRVNAVSPGPVRTDLLKNNGFTQKWDDFVGGTALGKISEADEIADLVVYLASDKAKSVTGSVFVIDNGALLKH